jgi:hypothetical protein
MADTEFLSNVRLYIIEQKIEPDVLEKLFVSIRRYGIVCDDVVKTAGLMPRFN